VTDPGIDGRERGPRRTLRLGGSIWWRTLLDKGPSAFRHRNFRLYWSGQLVSLIGTHMQRAAQAWLVLTLTNDPLMLGLLVTAQFGPVLVFGLLGGIVADSFPKRTTILVTQVISLVLALALGLMVATGIAEVWQVMLLALLLGLTSAIDIPARQTFVIEMVGPEDVTSAVALNSTLVHAAKVLGPAIGGVTIAVFGLATAFFLNAISFAAVIAGLLAMRTSELLPAVQVSMPRTGRALFDSLAEGLRYALRTPQVLLPIAVVGLVSTLGMNFPVLFPPYARDVLGTDASGYGFLMAATGAGAIGAALFMAFRGRPRPIAIPIAALVLGLFNVVLALSGSMPIALLSASLIGLASVVATTYANTTIQTTAPDQLRGRVTAVYVSVHAGSMPVGGIIFGALAGAFGAAAALAIGGLCTILVGVVALVVVTRMAEFEAPGRHPPSALSPSPN
jgi:MFS family permease